MKKIFNKKPLWMNMDEAYQNTHFLLKYFPKYYYKAEYQMKEIKNKKICDKTKRLKLINKFFIQDYNESGQGKIINLIKGSRKSVKSNNFTDSRIQRFLPKITKFRLEVQKIDSWKTLARSLNVKDLTVEFCGANLLRMNGMKKVVLQRNLEGVFWRILLKLRKLNKFSLLITNDFSRLIANFFQKLNQLALFLQSLDDFSIILNCIRLEQSSSFDFLNIFGRVKNLKILELNNSLFERVLQTQHLAELRSLTLIKTTFLPEDDEEILLNFGPFRNLKDLHNLQSLELSLYLRTPGSFKSFLESFSLPGSIKSLNLSFHEICWNDPALGIDLDFGNTQNKSFVNQKIFVDFYKKWANLDQLKSLSLCFAEGENAQNPSLYFLAPIFANLMALKKLYYANIHNNEFGRKAAVDLNYFLESLEHLRNTLNSLIVEAHAISIRKVSLDLLKQFNFEDLAFCGFILGDTNLAHLFSLFSQKRTEQKFELETLVIDSDENFSKFLENLACVPKRTDVLLSADIRKVSADIFVDKLAEKLHGLNKKHLGLTFRCTPDLNPGEFERLCKSLLNSADRLKYLTIYDHSGNEIYNNENSLLLVDFKSSSSSVFTFNGELKSEKYLNDESQIDEEEEDDDDDDDDYFDMEDVFDDGFEDIIEDL